MHRASYTHNKEKVAVRSWHIKSGLLGSGVRVQRLYHGSGLRAHASGSDLFRVRAQGEGIQPFRVTSRS